MKIKDSGQVTELQPRQGSQRPATEGKALDRVSLDRSASFSVAVAAAKAEVPAAHLARLAAIEAAVRNGSYRPSPEAIAEKILDDAELAARLRSLLGG